MKLVCVLVSSTMFDNSVTRICLVNQSGCVKRVYYVCGQGLLDCNWCQVVMIKFLAFHSNCVHA